jgi:diguanylate cyclase (GGDEF)-like protein
MLTKTIYGLDHPKADEQSSTIALGAYLDILQSIERHAVEIEEQATSKLRRGIRALQDELSSNRPASIESTPSAVDTLLGSFHDATLERYKQREADLRAILVILGSATESLAAQGERQNLELKGLTEQLYSACRLQDLGEIRRALTKQVHELRVATETMQQEQQRSVSALQAQLAQFQARLQYAEKLAATDELTGVLNRREGQAQLTERLANGNPFCLMLLDLDQFKAINDRYGHHAGDQVLRIFAKKLANLVRPCDIVCRWGGDEFAVVLEVPLETAHKRAAQICSKLGGRYTVVMLGKEVPVQVSVSIGVAEYQCGDDIVSVFARADEGLYRHKKTPQSV